MLTKCKIVFKVCFACCQSGKKEVVVEKSKRTGVVNKPSSLISCTAPSQSSRGDYRENVDMVVENVQRKRKQSTLPFTISVAEKKKSVCVEFSDEESNNKGSEVPCSICNDVDDPTKTHNITWVDCDTSKIWVHKSCATQCGWLNVKRKSWLCVAHIK